MQFEHLATNGPVRITLEERRDARGFFARIFCAEEFAREGLDIGCVQANNSLTKVKGTVRGLHFQRAPAAEAKLVRCVRGAIFDVAVDLRAGSDTFGSCYTAMLTAENREMLYVPPGFAHGFQALEDCSEIIYFNSAPYTPEVEGGLKHDDPDVGIVWPLPVAGISERDAALPGLSELEPISL